MVQGWDPDDYLRCVDLYDRAGIDLTRAPLVAAGTLCRRQSTDTAGRIITALHAAGITRLHGFGFKVSGLARYAPLLASADSLAWSYAARRRPPLPGCIGHRNCANCPRYAYRWHGTHIAPILARQRPAAVQLPLFSTIGAPDDRPDPARPTRPPEPRPGSRAARTGAAPRRRRPQADGREYGVCIRPVALRRTDLTTGQTELIDLPCGATREDKCPPCAKRARRLRQVQIREGWHRTDEPTPAPDPATDEQTGADRAAGALRVRPRRGAAATAEWDQVADLDDAIAEVEQAIAAEGLRGRVAPPHADAATTRATRPTGRAGCGPPAAGRTCRTCPGRRSSRAPSAAPTPPRTAPSTGRRCG